MTTAERAISTAWIGTGAPSGGALGLLPELERDALGLLTRCTREYGDLVRIRLGLTPTIVVGHPDLVEEVLVTRNHDYRKSLSTRRLNTLLGNGLLLSDGDFWLRQRRLMQPAFHRERLAKMADTMVASAAEVIDGWRDGDVRAINHDMIEITLRIVARTLFGTEVGDDLARMRRTSPTFTEHFRSRLFSLLILLPDSVPTPGNLRYRAARKDLEQLVFRIIAERRASREVGDDLLSMLLAARDDTGQGMTDRQLRDEVMTLLLAGHDTTALALTWTWILLSKHPEVDLQFRAELRHVLDGWPPTASDIPRLKYASSVFAETLRLYPTAWAIGRESIRETRIGGQHVAKGTTVLVVPWVMHRDPRFYEAPDAFRPGRWADGLAERLPRYAYMPFGGGQRICIGSSFAQMEGMLLLATIGQRFNLALADPPRPVEPWPVITLRTREDVLMRLTSCGRE
jgi:cytochrome P450